MNNNSQESTQVLDEATAYHGSAYLFDEFDVAYIGSGEGNQAHGWGLYFALNEETAQSYRRTLTGSDTKRMMSYKGRIYYENTLMSAILTNIMNGKGHWNEHLLTKLKDDPTFNEKHPKFQRVYPKLINSLKNIDQKQIETVELKKGDVYTVEIPELEYYLDEQKTFKEQSEFVQQAVRKLYSEVDWVDEEYLDKEYYTGFNIYHALRRGGYDDKEGSLLLYKYGIVGIKYHGSIDGDCVVIFNSKDVKIINNTQPTNINKRSLKIDNKDNIPYIVQQFNIYNKIVGFNLPEDIRVDEKTGTIMGYVDLDNVPYDEYSSRETVSENLFKTIIKGENDYGDNFYSDVDDNTVLSQDVSTFNKILQENNVPYSFEELFELSTGSNTNVEGLNPEFVDAITTIFQEDFSGDGVPIYSIIADAERYGSGKEAYDDCWKQLQDWYPFITAETAYIQGNDYFRVKIDINDLVGWYAYNVATGDEDSEYYQMDDDFWTYYNLKYHNGYDDVLSISEPYYGWSGFDDEYMEEALKVGAKYVIEAYNKLQRNYNTKKSQSQYDQSIQEVLRVAGIKL